MRSEFASDRGLLSHGSHDCGPPNRTGTQTKLPQIIVILVCLLAGATQIAAQPDTGWVRYYDGPASSADEAWDIAIDDNGCVYVTGTSVRQVGWWGLATIKYAPNGDTLWTRRWDGMPGGSASTPSLALDDSGYVYVAGSTSGISAWMDFTTIKYTPVGDTVWVRYYDGGGNDGDYATALAVDASGCVFVTGRSFDDSLRNDYATVKYSPSGDMLWIRRYNGPANWSDNPSDLAVDDQGNVYVTGSSFGSNTVTDYDFATIKYSPVGDTLWVRRYDGPAHSSDRAKAIAVDTNGNVYVSGDSYGIGTHIDYALVKYSPDGDELWVRRFNGPPGNNMDRPYDLALNSNGDVLVTGISRNGSPFDFDWCTINYSPAGDTNWIRRYGGPDNASDDAYAVTADANANVYVTGRSRGLAEDLVLVKYSAAGTELWAQTFNGPANGHDLALEVTTDATGNIYVAGITDFNGPLYNYVTIKYRSCPIDLAGTLNGDEFVTAADIITLVNYTFKSGPVPEPCEAAGDIDCDGVVSSTDVISLVGYVFRGGSTPCAVCTLIPGTWSCP